MLECAVRFATQNDMIHVAVIPAIYNLKQNNRIMVSEKAYTSFINCGVEMQPVTNLFDGSYTFRFLAVNDVHTFVKGMDFLNGLVGASYNRLSLVSTLLPRCFKGAGRIPEWISCENKGLMPRKEHPAVFCSQMALMLCYTLNAVSNNVTLDPAACSPGELDRILHNEPNCRVCSLNSIEIF